MGHTLEDWHREAAEIASGARARHEHRTRVDDERERADAVTVWRRTAHLLAQYANGDAGDTWEGFWRDAMNRDAYLRLIVRRSRFNRCDADGEAKLTRDSVKDWERDLAHEITTRERYVAEARRSGTAESARRMALELQVGLSVAAAYTGCSLDDLRDALRDCDGGDPEYGSPEGHPLFELINGNRPTV